MPQPGYTSHKYISLCVVSQFSSVAQSYPTICNPMGCSMPGFLVHHELPELTQAHVHWVGDAIQPSHPLSPPSPPAFNLSKHQGLSKWVSSSNQLAKILALQPQHESFQWIFRTDFRYCLGHRLGLLWYWMFCLGNEQRSFCHFWDCIQVLHFGLFCWLWGLLHSF